MNKAEMRTDDLERLRCIAWKRLKGDFDNQMATFHPLR